MNMIRLLFLVACSVPFYSQAKIVKVTDLLTSKPIACTPSIGQVVDTSVLHSCILGSTIDVNWVTYTVTDTKFGTYAQYKYSKNSTHKWGNWFSFVDSSCSAPVNPETGVCEEDEPEPEPSYCKSEEAQKVIVDANFACASVGGHFSYMCDDASKAVKTSCNSEPLECTPEDPKWPNCVKPPEPPPEECKEGSSTWPMCADIPKCTATNPNWPFCLYPPEPDEPDNPDFDSSNPPSTTDPTAPLDPDPETPPVDVLPPDEGNGNILKAIANLNKDNNELITRLNKDLNSGLSSSNQHLETINKNTIGFWEDSINGFNNINQSINNQNDVIRNTGNMTNNYLGTLTKVTGDGLDDVVDAVNKLGEDKLVDIDNFTAHRLYTSEQLSELNKDVESLKSQYTDQLNKFKSYFNFQTEVKSGEYNTHTLKQNWGGQELSFDSFALTVFVDNADIIGLVIIFGFGIAGVRIILETI